MKLPRSLVGFSITGLGATGIHVLVAGALLEWARLGPVLANGVAFCAANVFSFCVNSRWSFSQPLSWLSLRRFFIVSVLSGAATLAIAACAQAVGLHHWAGLALVVLLVPPMTYLAHRFYTFVETA